MTHTAEKLEQAIAHARPSMLRYAIRKLFDEHRAEDLVQTVITEALHSIDTTRDIKEIVEYLYGRIRFACMDKRRIATVLSEGDELEDYQRPYEEQHYNTVEFATDMAKLAKEFHKDRVRGIFEFIVREVTACPSLDASALCAAAVDAFGINRFQYYHCLNVIKPKLESYFNRR